ncbi:unnamed protein product [Polarella glacialis]|uniref:Uncharacterized protein n=1 Tax=Polarella glacialis TaxID=89957 RepID=A0A813H4N0_POLGL|nr:unnamed protein product [Polarella glacialis]
MLQAITAQKADATTYVTERRTRIVSAKAAAASFQTSETPFSIGATAEPPPLPDESFATPGATAEPAPLPDESFATPRRKLHTGMYVGEGSPSQYPVPVPFGEGLQVSGATLIPGGAMPALLPVPGAAPIPRGAMPALSPAPGLLPTPVPGGAIPALPPMPAQLPVTGPMPAPFPGGAPVSTAASPVSSVDPMLLQFMQQQQATLMNSLMQLMQQ